MRRFWSSTRTEHAHALRNRSTPAAELPAPARPARKWIWNECEGERYGVTISETLLREEARERVQWERVQWEQVDSAFHDASTPISVPSSSLKLCLHALCYKRTSGMGPSFVPAVAVIRRSAMGVPQGFHSSSRSVLRSVPSPTNRLLQSTVYLFCLPFARAVQHVGSGFCFEGVGALSRARRHAEHGRQRPHDAAIHPSIADPSTQRQSSCSTTSTTSTPATSCKNEGFDISLALVLLAVPTI